MRILAGSYKVNKHRHARKRATRLIIDRISGHIKYKYGSATIVDRFRLSIRQSLTLSERVVHDVKYQSSLSLFGDYMKEWSWKDMAMSQIHNFST